VPGEEQLPNLPKYNLLGLLGLSLAPSLAAGVVGASICLTHNATSKIAAFKVFDAI
jgi:hypothetical protein